MFLGTRAMAGAEVEVHAAALMVALIRAGELEAAEGLYDWYVEWFGDSDRLETLMETLP